MNDNLDEFQFSILSRSTSFSDYIDQMANDLIARCSLPSETVVCLMPICGVVSCADLCDP
jgi:hypothetical protein